MEKENVLMLNDEVLNEVSGGGHDGAPMTYYCSPDQLKAGDGSITDGYMVKREDSATGVATTSVFIDKKQFKIWRATQTQQGATIIMGTAFQK